MHDNANIEATQVPTLLSQMSSSVSVPLATHGEGLAGGGLGDYFNAGFVVLGGN